MMAADRRFRDALRALAILEEAGFAARLAGGCVRDRLLGLTPKDFDIATTASPEAATAAFSQSAHKVVPTGIEHGTVTVVFASGPIEVTTLRRDVATDGRHAVVAFTGATFEDDAARRDFTINAMYEDRHGALFDYFGGQADLNARRLAFVGEPSARITEDYLRILRFFRFWARFGFHPDPAALKAIATLAPGLKRISQERITSELLMILGEEAAISSLKAMATSGVLGLVLPEANLKETALVPLSAVAPRSLGRLALLLQPGTNTEALASRLKLSTADGRLLSAAVAGPPSVVNDTADAMAAIDALEDKGGEGSFLRFFAPLWQAAGYSGTLSQLCQIEERQGALRQTKLPLSGADLMTGLGLGPGPELGRLLSALLRSFRNGEWRTKDEGLAWAQKALNTPG